MKIALVGLGRTTIPAKDMGSIENIIWNYKLYLEREGHEVDIYNSIWIMEVIYELNQKDYDFIHLHSDLHILPFNKHLKKPYCLTTHSGAFSRFRPGHYDYFPAFNYLYSDALEAPGNIVISDQIEKIFKSSHYQGFMRVLRNPIETERFRFSPAGNGKALCLGRIQSRKQQAALAKSLEGRVTIDFAGPWDKEQEPNFVENSTAHYIGNWEKEILYEHLTDYSCLVLFSKSEADPLVVKEALAAGLSVVISDACKANLTDEPFITVLPDEAINQPDVLAAAINAAIKENPEYRKAAREYAVTRFDYSVIIPEYLEIIQDFKKTTKN